MNLRNNTWDKVLFGMWLLWTFICAMSFIAGSISGEPEYHELVLAMCGVVILQLYWDLWHAKQTRINIYCDKAAVVKEDNE